MRAWRMLTSGTVMAEPIMNRNEEQRADTSVNESDIAALAYSLWEERGCPIGSPEEDWHRAEQTLKPRRSAESAGAGAHAKEQSA